MSPTIVALVPMRHHSQRVPGKNYRLIAGKPLYAYIIETLSDCPQIDQIAVDTDSPIIQEGLQKNYPAVQVIPRPEALRGDTVSMNDILMYDTSVIHADFYLQTHSTNPLLTSKTINQALQIFLAEFPKYDSLFSVTPWHKRLWSVDGKPINHDPAVLLQTQDLPPVFEENSCMYLFTRENLLKKHNRLGQKPYLFSMNSIEAMDIDDEEEFIIVDTLIQKHFTEANK